MKVLHRPQPETWKKEVTCHCTAVLEVNVEDIVYGAEDRPCGDIFCYVNCPCCHGRANVEFYKLPEAIRHYLREA